MQNINSLNKSIKRQETEKWTKDICRRKAEESIDMWKKVHFATNLGNSYSSLNEIIYFLSDWETL